MNIEQVYIEVMHARLTVNTPAEEKDTLLQAVGMLNGKAEPSAKAAASRTAKKSSLWPRSTSSTTY